MEEVRQAFAASKDVGVIAPVQKQAISPHNIPDRNDKTPFVRAVLEADFAAFCAMAAAPDIVVNRQLQMNGNTPLHISVWNDRADFVALLLKHPKIDPSIKNYSGKTAFEMATEKGNREIIQLFEEHGQR